jgi:hypothetical protein
MALSANERVIIAEWLAEVSGKLEELNRRVRELTTTVEQDRPPPEPSTPAG